MKKQRLTEEDKFLIGVMRYLGYKQDEIAEELGVTRSAIQYQLRQKRKKAEEIGIERAFWEEIEKWRDNLLTENIKENITDKKNVFDFDTLSNLIKMAAGSALFTGSVGTTCALILARAMKKRKQKKKKGR